jgi:hypothetical protein
MVAWAPLPVGFPPSHLDSRRIERQKRPSINKVFDKTIPRTSRKTSAAFGSDHATRNIAMAVTIGTRWRFLRATANRDRNRRVPHRQWRESRKPLFSGLIFIFEWNWKYRRVTRRESKSCPAAFFENRSKRSSVTARCELQATRLAPRRRPCAKIPGASVAEFGPHFRTRGLDVPVSFSRIPLEKPRAEFQESSKWLAIAAAPNLPLAARPRVGHIGLDGAVAEWLKAAVC